MDPCPRAGVVDQLYGATLAMFRRPEVSISTPGRLGLGMMAGGVDQLSRTTRAPILGSAVSVICPGQMGPGSVFPRCRPALRGDSGHVPQARGVDQHSRATWPGTDGRRGRPAVPDHSGLGRIVSVLRIIMKGY